MSDILVKIKELPGRLLNKKNLLFIGPGAVLIILIVVILGINRGSAKGTDTLRDGFQPDGLRPQSLQPQIPPGELFLPEEPDFLPALILGRERRDAWTAEDAEPFWHNPLEGGEEQWRARIESVIDELLEHVP